MTQTSIEFGMMKLLEICALFQMLEEIHFRQKYLRWLLYIAIYNLRFYQILIINIISRSTDFWHALQLGFVGERTALTSRSQRTTLTPSGKDLSFEKRRISKVIGF